MSVDRRWGAASLENHLLPSMDYLSDAITFDAVERVYRRPMRTYRSRQIHKVPDRPRPHPTTRPA